MAGQWENYSRKARRICPSTSGCIPQRNRRSIRLLPVVSAETTAQTQHHEKKSSFSKEQDPEKVAAYLEKIKDIPDEKLVYVDKTGIETQLFRQCACSPRGKRVNMCISSKRNARIGLVAAQCKGKLVAPFTYKGTMKAPYLNRGLKISCSKPYRRDALLSWTTHHSIKKVWYWIEKNILKPWFACCHMCRNTISLSTRRLP